jgi:hypothetical protein
MTQLDPGEGRVESTKRDIVLATPPSPSRADR